MVVCLIESSSDYWHAPHRGPVIRAYSEALVYADKHGLEARCGAQSGGLQLCERLGLVMVGALRAAQHDLTRSMLTPVPALRQNPPLQWHYDPEKAGGVQDVRRV